MELKNKKSSNTAGAFVLATKHNKTTKNNLFLRFFAATL